MDERQPSSEAPRSFHVPVPGTEGNEWNHYLMCGHKNSGESHFFVLGDLKVLLCDGCWSVIGTDFVRSLLTIRMGA